MRDALPDWLLWKREARRLAVTVVEGDKMASHEDESEDATWDPIPRRLKDVVENEPLPIVVKVLEGVYTESEGSTFSNGDLIKIDSYITVDKVQARKVRHGSHGESFTVPLDYHGKVALVPDLRGGHVVRVVNDLRHHVTKWVRVLQDVSFYHHGNEQKLCDGDLIKVVEFKGHVMSCTRGQVSLLVPSSVNGQFQVLPHCTEYSVRDVLTQFNLPQIVHFLPAQQQVVSETIVAGVSNMGVFSGDVVLECPMRERIVVGHFKGSGEDNSARFARRSVIILPLGDREVAELEVLLPHYSDESDYQFFQMTHFSQSSGELVLDPNALYMDFSRPGVRFIDYKDFGSQEKPPPRPPRRAASRPEVPMSGRESPDYLEPVDYAPPNQQAPSRPPRLHRISHPSPTTTPHQGTERGASSFTLADISRPDLPQQQGPAWMNKTKGLRKKIKRLFKGHSSSTSSSQEGPRSPTSPSSPSSPSRPSSPSSPFSQGQQPDSDSSEGDDYEQIEEKEETTQKKPKAWVRPNTCGTQPSSTTTTPTPTPVSSRIISPEEHPATDSFQKMGVAQITQLLEKCSMFDLARTVQEQTLDGVALSGLSREMLFQPPFNMKEFDLHKFELIKGGWRPKS